MARITITEYEAEHDRLPAVCMKCGQPTTDRLARTVRVLEEPGRWCGLFFVALLVSFFFLPPLLIVLWRRAKAVRLNLPMCEADRARTARQERVCLRVFLPVWVLFVLASNVSLVVGPLAHDPWWFFPVAIGLVLVLAVADVIHGRLRRRLKLPRPELALAFVHPAFVAAVVEDRARDRVDNADRRSGFGDIRDDFDDLPG